MKRYEARRYRQVSWALVFAIGLVSFATLADAQRTHQLTVTPGQFDDIWPRISEDGRTVAWHRADAGARLGEIWVADSMSRGGRALTSLRPISWLALSGDGSTIAFEEDGKLWSVPASGGVPRQVTNYPTGVRVSASASISLSFDGSKACYSIWQNPRRDVHVLDMATGAVTDVTRGRGSIVSGAISGDGRTVVLVSAGPDEVWAVDADGRNFRRLYQPGQAGLYSPTTDYYGSVCAFDLNGSAILRILTDGTGLLTIHHAQDIERSPDASADGEHVVWKSSAMNDIFMAGLDGLGGITQLTQNRVAPAAAGRNEARVSGDASVLVYSAETWDAFWNPQRDYEIFVRRAPCSRTGRAIPGQVVRLHLDDAQRPGAVYAARCSFGRRPGFRLAGAAIPLNPDPLFYLSGSLPSMFKNFTGVLDSSGLAQAEIVLPASPAISRVHFYASFITIFNGISKSYNAVKIRIE